MVLRPYVITNKKYEWELKIGKKALKLCLCEELKSATIKKKSL